MNSKGYTALDAERIKNCKTCNGAGIIDVGSVIPGGPICGDCDPYGNTDPEDAPAFDNGFKPAPEDRDDCETCGAYPAARNDEGDFCYPLSTRDGSDPTAGVCGWCARERVSR